MNDILHSTGTVIKSLPDTLEKADNTLWAYATVETKDRDGDVIRVNGIELERPLTESPLKIAVNHSYKALPDGSAAVLGVVDKLERTTASINGTSVPAMAFRMRWADTAFAKGYQKLYDDGILDSFSAGYRVPDPQHVKPLKGGRYDVQKCKMYEISSCLIPVNPHATVLKAMVEALGSDAPAMEVIEHRIVTYAKQLAEYDEHAAGFYKSLTERLDKIESAIAAVTAGNAGQSRGRRSPQPDDIQKLSEAVSKLVASMPR